MILYIIDFTLSCDHENLGIQLRALYKTLDFWEQYLGPHL